MVKELCGRFRFLTIRAGYNADAKAEDRAMLGATRAPTLVRKRRINSQHAHISLLVQAINPRGSGGRSPRELRTNLYSHSMQHQLIP